MPTNKFSEADLKKTKFPGLRNQVKVEMLRRPTDVKQGKV